MEGRVEGPDRHRQAVHHPEKPGEVASLHGEDLGERLFAALQVFRDNHLPHRIDPLTLEEHVLRPAQADALRPEGDGDLGLVGLVRVRPYAETPRPIGPLHKGVEILVDRGFPGFKVLSTRTRSTSDGMVFTSPAKTSPVLPFMET